MKTETVIVAAAENIDQDPATENQVVAKAAEVKVKNIGIDTALEAVSVGVIVAGVVNAGIVTVLEAEVAHQEEVAVIIGRLVVIM